MKRFLLLFISLNYSVLLIFLLQYIEMKNEQQQLNDRKAYCKTKVLSTITLTKIFSATQLELFFKFSKLYLKFLNLFKLQRVFLFFNLLQSKLIFICGYLLSYYKICLCKFT